MNESENSKKADAHRYDDIIHLKRPVSLKHRPMDAENRAAQFAPFAALTGFGEAVDETGRLTGRRIELDDNTREQLDEKLQHILTKMGHQKDVWITVTHFVKDAHKEGGAYITTKGCVKKIDGNNRTLVLRDGMEIDLEDIIGLQE